jgi:hypothetical protein
MIKKKINLFDLAEKNSGYLHNRYKQHNDNCSESQRALLNDFREILREKVEQYSTLAFIKEDSAVNYVEDRQVMLDRLNHDMSDKSCIPFLAAIKHKADIETNSLDRWPLMICNNNGYIEAITTGDILSDHIKCVRITRDFYNSIFNSLKRNFSGQNVSKVRLYRMSFFKHIMSELKKRGIEWEVIDEN